MYNKKDLPVDFGRRRKLFRFQTFPWLRSWSTWARQWWRHRGRRRWDRPRPPSSRSKPRSDRRSCCGGSSGSHCREPPESWKESIKMWWTHRRNKRKRFTLVIEDFNAAMKFTRSYCNYWKLSFFNIQRRIGKQLKRNNQNVINPKWIKILLLRKATSSYPAI